MKHKTTNLKHKVHLESHKHITVPVLKIKAKVIKELKDESRIDDPRLFSTKSQIGR